MNALHDRNTEAYGRKQREFIKQLAPEEGSILTKPTKYGHRGNTGSTRERPFGRKTDPLRAKSPANTT